MPAVSQTISPRDAMYDPRWPDAYVAWGKSALSCIRQAVDRADIVPERILDLPSGHGRVLRWLAAEFPRATITACDLKRDAVDFCAAEFGATPLYSRVEPEEIPLDRYDLIWVGSLLTHVDAPLWRRFLGTFAEHLDGLLLFTTAGDFVAEQMRQGGDNDVDREALLESYDRSGFGYANYRGRDAYGLSRATPAWVLALLATLPYVVEDLKECGWADRQDVYTVRLRQGATASSGPAPRAAASRPRPCS
jgi:SAM-dependent methyltransferase